MLIFRLLFGAQSSHVDRHRGPMIERAWCGSRKTQPTLDRSPKSLDLQSDDPVKRCLRIDDIGSPRTALRRDLRVMTPSRSAE